MERTGIEPAFSPRSTIKLPRVVGVITSDYHYCGSDSSHILLSVSVSPVPGIWTRFFSSFPRLFRTGK